MTPGAAPTDIENLGIGNHRLRCPHCGKRETDKTLSVTVEHDRTIWHCFRCGMAGAQLAERTVMRVGTPPKIPSHPVRYLSLTAQWRDVWRSLKPISGTAAEYLRARSCEIPPADGDLRCTESLRHPSGYVGPALVGLVTDALTGEPLTLHRTWIKADGKKADVDPPRLLLGRHRKQGGVIRLWPQPSVSDALTVSEGIESGLTAATMYAPVWSAIDAGNLGAMPVVDGVQSLLIAADNDPAGLRASSQCADRWHQAGRKVRILKSPIPGEDLNDYVLRSRAA